MNDRLGYFNCVECGSSRVPIGQHSGKIESLHTLRIRSAVSNLSCLRALNIFFILTFFLFLIFDLEF